MPHPLRLAVALLALPLSVQAVPLMEHLDRGGVAVPKMDGKTFVAWRVLASDPGGVAFNVYRTAGSATALLNPTPVTGAT